MQKMKAKLVNVYMMQNTMKQAIEKTYTCSSVRHACTFLPMLGSYSSLLWEGSLEW